MTESKDRAPESRAHPAERFERLFARHEGAPAIAGDRAREETVAGFCFDRRRHNNVGEPPAAFFDTHILSRGAAFTLVPSEELQGVVREGVRAPLRVHLDHPGRIRPATTHEKKWFEDMINRRTQDWRWSLGQLIVEAWRTGYEFWLVGGPVRDVLGGALGTIQSPPDRPGDVDCTGTIPAGEFRDLLTAMLEEHERFTLGPLPTKWCPVVSVIDEYADPKPKAVLEYKPLELRDLRLPEPACDNDLVHDADGRDLTINSIYYDPMYHYILDPTGQGIAHLTPLTLAPGSATTAWRPLPTFLRLLRFIERYQKSGLACETETAEQWVAEAQDAILHGLHDENEFGLKRLLQGKFYGNDGDPDDDPGLTRVAAAASPLGSLACKLADAISEAYG